MAKFMLGRKAGMTQLFDEDGISIPVTVIACGPLKVIQNKTVEKDGYVATRVGYENYKKASRPHNGQFSKVEVAPMRYIREFTADEGVEYEAGQEVNVADMFSEGDFVDISGVSKGKGFQGSIKRHGMSRGPMAHGSKYHRSSGSMGSSATPGKVFKGKKLPGQMGNERVTVQNLKVVQVDGERHILVVRGSVPGPKRGLLEIKTSVKGK
ncbi:MAG: 50S ribosomal protein L3 [Eubacteriales bacterium]|nr:50S ribosomal protein L3 [Eubacteriales bacterium]MDD4323292.1 50S ribosomal protein L3 [Eubacteriales bacterium]MDD4540975.1 50S ribosomal protein L3 [Eubacteriales bacterium]